MGSATEPCNTEWNPVHSDGIPQQQGQGEVLATTGYPAQNRRGFGIIGEGCMEEMGIQLGPGVWEGSIVVRREKWAFQSEDAQMGIRLVQVRIKEVTSQMGLEVH